MQILKKFIGNDQVDGEKIQLANDQAIVAKDNSNADVELIKLNASNEVVLPSVPKVGADTLATKNYVDTIFGTIPDPVTYKGTWDASLNSPALSDSDTGKAGWLYNVSVGGSINLGSGVIQFSPGDKVVNNGTTWDKWDMSAVDIITQTISSGETTLAPSSDAVSGALTLKQDIASMPVWKKESITLSAGDIANGYVDLTAEAMTDSLDLVVGGLVQTQGDDYTLSIEASVTRITWTGNLATIIGAGDVLNVKYQW